jgi:cation diffusion facilitator CzcD-associated flavoprotein CzcO
MRKSFHSKPGKQCDRFYRTPPVKKSPPAYNPGAKSPFLFVYGLLEAIRDPGRNFLPCSRRIFPAGPSWQDRQSKGRFLGIPGRRGYRKGVGETLAKNKRVLSPFSQGKAYE